MSNITTPFSGGCACGAVRYESTAEPVFMLHCHCRDCQRSSGGPFSSFVIVPKASFHFSQGTPAFHASDSEAGGKTRRGFCPQCGSPLVSNPDAVPDLVAIRTASLDAPGFFSQQAEVWVSDADDWQELNPKVPNFDKYPGS